MTSNAVGCGALPPAGHDIVLNCTVDGMTTAKVVVPSGFGVEEVMLTATLPILIRAKPSAFSTVMLVVPPMFAGFGEIAVISGFGVRKMKVGPVAVSPLSVLVTTMGPITSAQLVRFTPVVLTMTSEPDTLMTCAAIPATTTASGSSNPLPSIRMRVPPVNGPSVGPTVVITILGVYRKPPESVTMVPELMFFTVTSTGPV